MLGVGLRVPQRHLYLGNITIPEISYLSYIVFIYAHCLEGSPYLFG